MEALDAKEHASWQGGPSFTLRNKIYRLSWIITWTLLAAWTPPPLRSWRVFLLRMFGAKVATSANVYGSARIWSPANLHMGEYSCIGPKSNIYSMGRVFIHDYAIVSQGAHICTGTHNIEDTNFQLYTRDITIGARAWIAAEAFIGPGVTVGAGAVLGARGCAFRNLDEWTVYAGNPAQAIKRRHVRF